MKKTYDNARRKGFIQIFFHTFNGVLGFDIKETKDFKFSGCSLERNWNNNVKKVIETKFSAVLKILPKYGK